MVTGEPANTTICNNMNAVLFIQLNAAPEGVLDRQAAAADDPSLPVAHTS